MADNISDYAENKLLDHVLGVSAFTMPGTVWGALYTDDPTDADSGSEGSAGGYLRPEITFGAAAAGAADNDDPLCWGTASADWGTITHVGIRDAASDGNLLWHGALEAQKIVANGDSFTIPAGSLQVSLA